MDYGSFDVILMLLVISMPAFRPSVSVRVQTGIGRQEGPSQHMHDKGVWRSQVQKGMSMSRVHRFGGRYCSVYEGVQLFWSRLISLEMDILFIVITESNTHCKKFYGV